MGFIQSYIKLSERCPLIRCRKPYILQIPYTLGVKNMVKKIKSPIEALEAQVIAEAQAEKEATVKAWIKTELKKLNQLDDAANEAVERYGKAVIEYNKMKELPLDALYEKIKGTLRNFFVNCTLSPNGVFGTAVSTHTE
jgi:hypothetical protein